MGATALSGAALERAQQGACVLLPLSWTDDQGAYRCPWGAEFPSPASTPSPRTASMTPRATAKRSLVAGAGGRMV